MFSTQTSNKDEFLSNKNQEKSMFLTQTSTKRSSFYLTRIKKESIKFQKSRKDQEKTRKDLSIPHLF